MIREQAIKMLRGMKAENLNLNDLYTRDKYEALLMAIKALEQEPKWIPCSERLPEDRELVLLSTVTDDVFEGRFFDDNTDCQWYVFRPDAIVPNHVVTAWMPLPKPYREVKNDKRRTKSPLQKGNRDM